MLAALLGGALIGLGATIFWFCNRRIAGVSGVVSSAVRDAGSARWVSIAFILGLASAGAVLVLRQEHTVSSHGSIALVGLAGLLVGFGARLGGGCTSGHGVCGISRSSVRSVAATLTFMTTGFIIVFLMRHVISGIGGTP